MNCFLPSVDLCTLFEDIRGRTSNVCLNSNIYRHSNMDYTLRGISKLDLTEDIHVIQGSEETPISFLQLKELIEKLHHQMMELVHYRPYNYGGITFNKRTNMYEINWGS